MTRPGLDLRELPDAGAVCRHIAAAVAEGLCPGCRMPLIPVPAVDDRIAGYCPGEGSWWHSGPAPGIAGRSRGVSGWRPEWLA